MGVASKKGSIRNKNMKEVIAKVRALDGEARESALDTLKMAIKDEQASVDEWRLSACKPKKGPVTQLLNAFERETDIPLELPFFCALHLVSGLLLDKGVRINGPVGEIGPEVWTIILAPSGAGKSFTHSAICKNAPVASDFPECASSAAFFESLKKTTATKGYGLWFQDEFAQILKQIETNNSPLAETKSYLLRAYDNSTIARTTQKNGEVTIQEPRLGILALNTEESFINAISMESMLDGFAQRFGVVMAREDTERHITDFPIYDMGKILPAVKRFWDDINVAELHESYEFSDAAIETYTEGFKRLFKSNLSKSFYRRIMFRAFKYALIYHVLLCKSSNKLDEEDIAYALELVRLHIEDMTKFICMKKGVKDFVEAGKKAQRFLDIAKRKGSNKQTAARSLIANHKADFTTADEAQFFIDLLG